MTDSLQHDISFAEARATTLDDREVVENLAVYRWLGKHQITIGNQHFVVGSQALPPAWQQEMRSFTDVDGARSFLGQFFGHNHKATSGLRRLLSSALTLVPGESDDAYLQRLSEALVAGRVWVITAKHMPPNKFVGKTDPKVFNTLNPRFGAHIDFNEIAKLEGNQWRRGYIPMRNGVVVGASGMTIATGFDIGQWSTKQLDAFSSSKRPANLRLTTSLAAKLKPFCGHPFKNMTKLQVAKKVAQLGPVPEIEKAEADLLDAIVFSEILRGAIADWDRHRSPGVPAFTDLPPGWQTVWLSRNFQEGGNPKNSSAREFRKAALKGDWANAIAKLKGYTDYKARAMTEASALEKVLPQRTEEQYVHAQLIPKQ